jgi:hypothetical protein
LKFAGARSMDAVAWARDIVNEPSLTKSPADFAASAKKLLAGKAKWTNSPLSLKEWHTLVVRTAGDEMTASIDGKSVASFTSTGIGHDTKSLVSLTTNLVDIEYDDFSMNVGFDIGLRRWRRCSCGRRFRFCDRRCRSRRLRSRRGSAGRFEGQDQRTHRHLVAGFEADGFDDAGARRGDVHRRLVGLQRDQRVFLVHRIAGFHQHFNDRDALEITDIRDFDFDRLAHV